MICIKWKFNYSQQNGVGNDPRKWLMRTHDAERRLRSRRRCCKKLLLKMQNRSHGRNLCTAATVCMRTATTLRCCCCCFCFYHNCARSTAFLCIIFFLGHRPEFSGTLLGRFHPDTGDILSWLSGISVFRHNGLCCAHPLLEVTVNRYFPVCRTISFTCVAGRSRTHTLRILMS